VINGTGILDTKFAGHAERLTFAGRISTAKVVETSDWPRSVPSRTSGYPGRFAQEALGHNRKAVHCAYARKAHVVIPSLEDYEKKMNAVSDE
jgi:hypothetical protein